MATPIDEHMEIAPRWQCGGVKIRWFINHTEGVELIVEVCPDWDPPASVFLKLDEARGIAEYILRGPTGDGSGV